ALSSLADPKAFEKISGQGRAICCNRPFESYTLPLALLHEAFSIFRARCKAAPSKRALDCLKDLAPVACKWYDSEIQRREQIRSVFKEQLGLGLYEQKVTGTEYMTDGNLFNVMPAAIRECKKEEGAALNQAILYYGKFLLNALEHRHRYYNFDTHFPCILLVDMGTHLEFYGATWDGMRVRAEPLTGSLQLATHEMETAARNVMASTLDAFVVAVENIQVHYNSIEAKAKASLGLSEHYSRINQARNHPFVTSYQDSGQEIKFTYDARLHDEKLIFSATVNEPNSGECIVKFTQRYSEEVHSYLASRGWAPRLRKCIRVGDDWIAVVMDRSTYEMLYDLSFGLTPAEKEKVRQKVERIVQGLHEKGYVHGDIRDTNLLVDRNSLSSDDVTVHLVDFDWAGRIGEVRYPYGVNCETMKRPAGVEYGTIITVEHDIEMVSYL
ncbi:hypothetical protein AN958_00231, partial [Leucoagaricus sp. SymC.cos]